MAAFHLGGGPAVEFTSLLKMDTGKLKEKFVFFKPGPYFWHKICSCTHR